MNTDQWTRIQTTSRKTTINRETITTHERIQDILETDMRRFNTTKEQATVEGLTRLNNLTLVSNRRRID
jgi:hypothetical protein